MFRHFMLHLLTYRYCNAALIIRGIEDFLSGPSVIERPALEVHASVTGLRALYPAQVTSRGRVLKTHLVPKLPKKRLGYSVALLRVLARSWMLPVQAAPPTRLDIGHHAWIVLEHTDHIALDTWWDAELPTYSRSRPHFRTLLRRGAKVLLLLLRQWGTVSVHWRTAQPKLTLVGFWRTYLGHANHIGSAAATSGAVDHRAAPQTGPAARLPQLEPDGEDCNRHG